MRKNQSSRGNSAIFFIFLLLSSEVHAARIQKSQLLSNGRGNVDKSKESDLHSMAGSTSLAISSDQPSGTQVQEFQEDPGVLEKLGYYGLLGKKRRAFLRSKVPDEMLRKALVYSVCVRVKPASHGKKKGYGPEAPFEVRCSEDYDMLGGINGSDWLLGMMYHLAIPKKSKHEDKFVMSEFEQMDQKLQVFPRKLSILPNNTRLQDNPKKKWPPYTPKIKNRFMVCFGNAFESASWGDCTGFWSKSKAYTVVSDMLIKLGEQSEKKIVRLLDEIRSKALYSGSSSIDPMVVGKRVSTKKTFKLGVADMVVPLVRKALNKANIKVKLEEAKDLGLDARPLVAYSAQAGVEGTAPPLQSKKPLVDMFHDLFGKEASAGEGDHCIVPASNSVGACEILCNANEDCMGFNFHDKTNACCFFAYFENVEEFQVQDSDATTLFLKPSDSSSSLLQADMSPEVVAVACLAPQGGGGAGAAAGTIAVAGIAFPIGFIILGSIIVGLFTGKLAKYWYRKKKLSSKLTKFAKLMSPKYSVVTIGSPVIYEAGTEEALPPMPEAHPLPDADEEGYDGELPPPMPDPSEEGDESDLDEAVTDLPQPGEGDESNKDLTFETVEDPDTVDENPDLEPDEEEDE